MSAKADGKRKAQDLPSSPSASAKKKRVSLPAPDSCYHDEDSDGEADISFDLSQYLDFDAPTTTGEHVSPRVDSDEIAAEVFVQNKLQPP